MKLTHQVAAESRRPVLLVELRLAVVVLGVPSSSVVGVLPPLAQGELLLLHAQHFLRGEKHNFAQFLGYSFCRSAKKR